MQDLGDKARWPKNNEKVNTWKDRSKWCVYHEDFGHKTDDCIDLRKEISYHLKKILGRKNFNPKDKDQDSTKIMERATSHPRDAKVINFISRGSNIYRTTYFVTKRHAKVLKMENDEGPRNNKGITNMNEDIFFWIWERKHPGSSS